MTTRQGLFSKKDMKIKYIVIFAFVIFSLNQCNKNEAVTSYSNESIVIDQAQAAMYFQIVFREAEHAWALMDSIDYVEDSQIDPASTSTMFKKLTYNDSANIVTIEYQSWETNNYHLSGIIDVRFDKDVYRKEGEVANVYLEGFSINGQKMVGESSLKYRIEKDNVNDVYTYILLNGSAIHEEGASMPQLISGSIANARYERIEGGATFEPDDDVWTFSGTMTGMLRETPSLRYTNKVLTRDGPVQYAMNCKVARQGVSEIEIKGRPNVVYYYFCSEVFYFSSTDVN